ncbi:MAG: hypothetical protein HZB16_18335, partial [Armatimonadetes bacterium]|nr:hypothetical protein [Armatimonadota bacterium]
MRWLTRLLGFLLFALAPASAATPDEQAAAALAGRVLGPAAAGFVFEQRPADGGRDT